MSIPFFAELVTHTDEARRDFETDPVVLDAVANGMSIERYRRLSDRALSRRLALQPRLRSRWRAGFPNESKRSDISCTTTCTRNQGTKNGC